MDNRVRTMSRGYVKVTEVMPARPPQRSRWYASNGAPGSFSKNYGVSVCVGFHAVLEVHREICSSPWSKFFRAWKSAF